MPLRSMATVCVCDCVRTMRPCVCVCVCKRVFCNWKRLPNFYCNTRTKRRKEKEKKTEKRRTKKKRTDPSNFCRRLTKDAVGKIPYFHYQMRSKYNFFYFNSFSHAQCSLLTTQYTATFNFEWRSIVRSCVLFRFGCAGHLRRSDKFALALSIWSAHGIGNTFFSVCTHTQDERWGPPIANETYYNLRAKCGQKQVNFFFLRKLFSFFADFDDFISHEKIAKNIKKRQEGKRMGWRF